MSNMVTHNPLAPYHMLTRSTLLIIRTTGSHSCRYHGHAFFFFFFLLCWQDELQTCYVHGPNCGPNPSTITFHAIGSSTHDSLHPMSFSCKHIYCHFKFQNPNKITKTYDTLQKWILHVYWNGPVPHFFVKELNIEPKMTFKSWIHSPFSY